MSALRPELCDLIDADEADLPAIAARQQLRAHVERCPDCGGDRALRRALHADAAARPGDDALAAQLVQNVLAADTAPGVRVGARSRSTRPGRAPWLLAAAAGLVLVLSAAAGAALWTGGRLWRSRDREAAAAPPAVARSAPARPARAAAPARDLPAVAPAAPAPRPNHRLPPRAVSHVARPAAPAASAALLFAEANRLRQSGDYAGAMATYERLRRDFAGTREELTARVILGQVGLDKLDEPVRARALFESYLAAQPGGSLAEEARVGRALALQKMGLVGEERAAWHEVVQKHPRSVHADQARRRLRELDVAALPARQTDR